MVGKILHSLVDNFKRFLIVWLVILLANQLFIFGACFAPYCLAAALPHTFALALLANYFVFREEVSAPASPKPTMPPVRRAPPVRQAPPPADQPAARSGQPLCPLCDQRMVKRLAQRGPRAGRHFYGCTHYPQCRGVVNIDE